MCSVPSSVQRRRHPATVTSDLLPLLRCPRCRARVVESADDTGGRTLRCASSECDYATRGFPVLGQTPILIDFDRSIVDRDWIMQTGAASTKRRAPSLLTTLTYRLTAGPGAVGRQCRNVSGAAQGEIAAPGRSRCRWCGDRRRCRTVV